MARLKLSLPLLVLLVAQMTNGQTALPVDQGKFTVNEGSRGVGRTEFSIQIVKQGPVPTPGTYSVVSHGSIEIPSTKYSFSLSGSLDRNLAVLSENLNGVINGSAATFNVRTDDSNFAIDISANGRTYQNSITRSAQTVFFPDFDMAAYDILLSLVAAHPSAPFSALIPKQMGILSSATFARQSDVPATWNSSTLNVHHSSLTIGSVTNELYYSGNKILELDVPSQTFAIVRENFQLQQPPPPPPENSQGSQQTGDSPQGSPR